MARWVVATRTQKSGDNEVHTEGCPYFPDNLIELGDLIDCREAVVAARAFYPQPDGCFYCAFPCHLT